VTQSVSSEENCRFLRFFGGLLTWVYSGGDSPNRYIHGRILTLARRGIGLAIPSKSVILDGIEGGSMDWTTSLCRKLKLARAPEAESRNHTSSAINDRTMRATVSVNQTYFIVGDSSASQFNCIFNRIAPPALSNMIEIDHMFGTHGGSREKGLMDRNLKNPDAGFTLIELMIVVGIIGILVAIAAPNFSRYQSKARQSEAKLALAATYGAEKSFYSEYAAYIGSMDGIGYSPEGSRRFYSVGWVAAHSGTVTGYEGSYATGNWTAVNNTFGCTGGSAASLGAQLSTDSQTFIVGATGCIRQAQTDFDTWNIDDTKAIQNNVIAL